VDGVYACIPRKQPPPERIAGCKIIAHRGAHDRGAIENTLQAFCEARDAGCWGIEFDLRWSADDVPLVSHDAHGGRLFGDTTPLTTLTALEIRDRLPLIPTLAEVLEGFAGQVHLMIEVKEPLSFRQAEILEQLLAPYTACQDYHFLALVPALFESLKDTPPDACLAVSEINTSPISREVMRRSLGGHMGHFLLIHRRMRQAHAAAGQKVGTGFVSSRNTLFRELNRGTEWLFTNHPHRLQDIIAQHTNR
jgi:glycerophosphoryl diester phosphodiesterase